MNSNAAIPADPDTDIELRFGRYRLTCAPHGAALRSLWYADPSGKEIAIATAYSGKANKIAAQGDVLMPYPGRIRNGRYEFEGQTHQFALNDKESPGSIHGLVLGREWDLVERTEHSAKFLLALKPDDAPGYPFHVECTVRYTLSDTGLTVAFTMTNKGSSPAPVAAGFHPYFSVGSELIDTDLLTLPFSEMLEYVEMLPTGKIVPVAGTEFDFQTPRAIGGTEINKCFVNPKPGEDGSTRVRLTSADSNTSLTVWMDESFQYAVLYTGDFTPDFYKRRSLAIEPMTCGSDAFNFKEWGLVALQPEEVFAGEWGVGID